MLQSQQPEKKVEKSGLASFLNFSSMFEDTTKSYGDLSSLEVKKLVSHLDQLSNNFTDLFSVSKKIVPSIGYKYIRGQS